jgi:hypothetical protein
MELSLAGLIGAFAGLVIGWTSYMVIIRVLEPRLRQLDKSASPAERTAFEDKLAMMRRLILGIEVVTLTVVGYVLGHIVGG